MDNTPLTRFTFMENFYKVALALPSDELRGQYLMAIIEYGLYHKIPDDPILKSYIQAAAPSLDKSRGYHVKQATSGSAGGRVCKYSDEEIQAALRKFGRKATSQQIAEEVGISASQLRTRDVWKKREAYFDELEEVEKKLFQF